MVATRFVLKASMLLALVSTMACGGTTRFSGGAAFAINGTPPAAAEEPAPAARVELRDNKIDFKEKIQFEAGKATIKPESYSLLHEIAEVIRKNPQVKRISIEGHASADGEEKKNLRLSRDRARAVRKFLVKKEAIPTESLVSRGWGEDKPATENDTREGREANRRVEFLVIEQDVTVTKVEIDPKTGQEKVVEEKKDTVKAETAATEPAANGAKAKAKTRAQAQQ